MDREEFKRRIAVYLKRDHPQVADPDQIASTLATDLWPSFGHWISAQQDLAELRAALEDQFPEVAANIRFQWDGAPPPDVP